MKTVARKLLPSLALALLLAAARATRAEDDAAKKAIDPQDLKHTVEVLASDEFQGREGGTEGNRKAGDWLVSEIQKLGLTPAGDGGTYFQNFKSPEAKPRALRNIVATIPAREGSDLADETVVVGSHYDHVGLGRSRALDFLTGRGKVHHGADDNASGSAGTLGLARACCVAGPLRRRIVFIWFDGEELGLYGSLAYVTHPRFPLEKTVAMLNMDMIGRARNDRLTVYGLNTGNTFRELFGAAAKDSGLTIDEHETLPPNSDYFSFYGKRIPVIALFTGLHKDYHRATDTADKVLPESMTRIVRVAFGATRAIAQANGRARFAEAKPGGEAEEMLEQLQVMLSDEDLKSVFGGEDGMNKLFKDGGLLRVLTRLRGGSRPRFGISIDQEAEVDGVKVGKVTKASIAEKAGVKAGDVILAIGDRETGNFDTLTNAIRAAKGKVKVTVERGDERRELEADFGAAAAEEKVPEKRWF